MNDLRNCFQRTSAVVSLFHSLDCDVMYFVPKNRLLISTLLSVTNCSQDQFFKTLKLEVEATVPKLFDIDYWAFAAVRLLGLHSKHIVGCGDHRTTRIQCPQRNVPRELWKTHLCTVSYVDVLTPGECASIFMRDLYPNVDATDTTNQLSDVVCVVVSLENAFFFRLEYVNIDSLF